MNKRQFIKSIVFGVAPAIFVPKLIKIPKWKSSHPRITYRHEFIYIPHPPGWLENYANLELYESRWFGIPQSHLYTEFYKQYLNTIQDDSTN